MKPREGCLHGEVETDIARGTLTCQLCGTSAVLPRIPKIKNHKHKKRLFAGNGQVYYYCEDYSCGWKACQ